jgi:hypothetical protein
MDERPDLELECLSPIDLGPRSVTCEARATGDDCPAVDSPSRSVRETELVVENRGFPIWQPASRAKQAIQQPAQAHGILISLGFMV